jgi:hypothetical protein
MHGAVGSYIFVLISMVAALMLLLVSLFHMLGFCVALNPPNNFIFVSGFEFPPITN